MGTSNFYYKNTSKVFVVCENYENEDGEIVAPESFEIDMEFENIIKQLKENKGEFNFYKYDKLQSEHELRSFPSTYLGTLYKSKKFGDIDCEIEINIFVRSGYYEAACLDWEIKITIHCETFTFDEVNDISVYFPDYNSNMNKGMLTIQGKNCVKWLKKTKEKLVDSVEKIFENCSSTYNLVGRFSNGETIYEKC